jgi:hypothetical protein
MLLDSVRELKGRLQTGLERTLESIARISSLAGVIPAMYPPAIPAAALAFGISGRGRKEFQLAVRIRELAPGLESLINEVRRAARGEIEVRLVGRVVAQAPWHQRRNRPLRIGGSVGHVGVTAGTLGCFVAPRRGGDGLDRILSNNHVLARENRAKKGETIVQPGPADGGRAPRDAIARLDRFVPLKPKARNTVDAAVATLAEGVTFYYSSLEGRGELRGAREAGPRLGERVYKVGRTTGLTSGRISAIEVDAIMVEYERGFFTFDDQIEIEPVEGDVPFSLGGDSGSLIVDARGRALALLFAGNNVDTTYANPIGAVLETLDADLVF